MAAENTHRVKGAWYRAIFTTPSERGRCEEKCVEQTSRVNDSFVLRYKTFVGYFLVNHELPLIDYSVKRGEFVDLEECGFNNDTREVVTFGLLLHRRRVRSYRLYHITSGDGYIRVMRDGDPRMVKKKVKEALVFLPEVIATLCASYLC